MSERTKRLSRRSFLLAAGAGGVATAAAVALKSPAAKSPDKNKRSTRGYHASEHINNYYRTTKV